MGPHIDSAVYNGMGGCFQSSDGSNVSNDSSYLIELGGHIEIMDCRWLAIDTIEADEWVDFEIGKVKVDVDGVEADKEIN